MSIEEQISLSDAEALIERMKLTRPTCPECLRCSDEVAARACLFSKLENSEDPRCSIRSEDVQPWMAARGFEAQSHLPEYVKRCGRCAGSQTFPWAYALDLCAVANFINSDPRCENCFELKILEETIIPTTQPGGEVNVPKLLVHELGIGRLYDDVSAEPEEEVGDTGCAFKCMTCGADVPDLGLMRTPYYCQACIDLRNSKLLKTRERTLEAMYAYELAGSEEGALELLAGIDGKHAVKAPCTACGVLNCTKNHSEFT